MSAGCAEMRKPRKIGGFIYFGETGDEPNMFYFYFQHNNTPNQLRICTIFAFPDETLRAIFS